MANDRKPDRSTSDARKVGFSPLADSHARMEGALHNSSTDEGSRLEVTSNSMSSAVDGTERGEGSSGRVEVYQGHTYQSPRGGPESWGRCRGAPREGRGLQGREGVGAGGTPPLGPGSPGGLKALSPGAGSPGAQS